MAQSKEVTEALRLIELNRGKKFSKEELRKQAFEIAAAECRLSGDTSATPEKIEAAWQIAEDAKRYQLQRD